MHQIIRMGELTVVVLKDGGETNGHFCLCEVSVNANANLNFAHRHYTFDQTVVGVEGLLVWALGGEQVVVGPGERLFIPRGAAHGFWNRQSYPARFLCIYSPAVVTPEFFEALHDAEVGDTAERTAQIDAALERFSSGLVAYQHLN